MKNKYAELDKLEEYLKEKGIVYERTDEELNEYGFNRHQIMVYENKGDDDCIWDAICHYGSYGYEEGLLEIMGSLVDRRVDGDSVVGYLTADDVIERIEKRGCNDADSN